MCSIEIANQTIHQKTCILLCMEVYDYYFHCKEYAVITHHNVWYFYRYHPMLSNGTRGLALPAYFELLPWGTFPVFTQRTSCHFGTRRFTYFLSNSNQRRISAYLHRPVVLLTLAVSGEFLPAIASARGAQRNRDLRVIPLTFNSQ